MGQSVRIGRRRVRFRFFVFLSLLTIGVFYICKVVNVKHSYGSVQYGQITVWDEGDGLVVRQEKVYNAPDYGKVNYLVADGESINKEDVLATIYKPNYDYGLVEDLYQVKQKISSYQKSNLLNEVAENDYNKLDMEIKKLMLQVQGQILNRNLQSIGRKEKELRILLLRRQEVVDKKITPDEYLKKLYSEEARLNKQLEEWKIEIIAPLSGVISFQLDGLEELLNPGAIDYMSLEDFDMFLRSIPKQARLEETGADQPFFKIVNPEKWYLVCKIPSTNIFYEKGDIVKARITSSKEGIYEGCVYKLDKKSGSTLLTLEFKESIENVINLRAARVRIGKSTEGLMVPVNALIDSKEGTGVNVVYNGSPKFVKVKIMAMDDKYAIVEKIGDIGGLELHDRVLIK